MVVLFEPIPLFDNEGPIIEQAALVDASHVALSRV